MKDFIAQLSGAIQNPQPAQWIHCEVPLPPRPDSPSARVRRRCWRAVEVRDVAEECRLTLVSLSGESIPRSTCFSDGYCRRLPVTREVSDPAERLHSRLLFLTGRVIRVRRQHHVATGVRLQELVAKIGAAWDYTEHSDADSSAYVPVEGSHVAEPRLGSLTVQMLSVLPRTLPEWYAQPDLLFRPHTEAADILQRQNRWFFFKSWSQTLSTLLIWHDPIFVRSGAWSRLPLPKGGAPLLACPIDQAMNSERSCRSAQ